VTTEAGSPIRARRLVVSPHRQGGQAQFVEQPLPASSRDSRLGDLLDRVRASLDQPHTLDSLAAQALMSHRTFTRHFRQLTGNTVGAWLLGERLARSQQLLEATDRPVEQVAVLAGFGSAASMRQHFQRAFGITPSVWRQGFRGD
jgi:transcriptional regulator GlxA family with amidase domain